MADWEQLERLRSGVAAWNQWREDNPDSEIDLHGADLGGADLREADLRWAKLRWAKLREANLSGGADLREADLRWAKLSGADLRWAKLREADLSHAGLYGADLSVADLSDADLKEALLLETTFGGTFLGDALLDSCVHSGPSTLDFRTIQKSWPLPINFLRGCGLPENLIEYLPSLVGQAIQFFSCFISYNHDDKAFAHRLHAMLQDRGIRCWLDEKEIKIGHDLRDAVDRGIRLWDKMLVCCSRTSLAPTSRWVGDEIDKALEKEARLRTETGKDVFVLTPLDLDGYLFSNECVNSRGSELRRRLAARFQGWESSNSKFNEEFEKLVEALKDEPEKAPPPQRLGKNGG